MMTTLEEKSKKVQMEQDDVKPDSSYSKVQTVLVAGATGATGKLLVEQLLEADNQVKVIVRSRDRLPETTRENEHLNVTEKAILDLSDEELKELVKDCDAIACCLGHNLSWKGIYGDPRRLVADSVRRLCMAVKAGESTRPRKFILMNTVANRNRDLDEPITVGQRVIIALLRLLLPPHPDNEAAADYLRTEIGQDDDQIEWVAVRPDALIDLDQVTPYDLYPSPIRNPIFKAGKTSRINVAHFMAELITNDELWKEWKGQMPVIYNH